MEGPIDDSAMMELLAKHLAGECTPAQEAEIAAWLAADPENERTLEALRAIWTDAPAPDPQAQARTDAAWARMQARMQSAENTAQEEAAQPSEQPLSVPKPAYRAWMQRAAAILAVGLSIGLIFYLNQLRKSPETELVAVLSGDAPLTDTLPDGTVVHLNAHSRLEYPKAFAAGERIVGLEGEGFFEVAHDAAHPFRIHAGGADVRVLGTSFNLSTRGARVQVAVATGKVELSAAASKVQEPNEKVLLTAGMAGSYDPVRKTVAEEDVVAENAQFWRTKRLVFQDVPMEQVVAELNAAYGDSVALGNPAIAHCPLNTRFEGLSIDSVLAVIAETFAFKVTRNGKIYQLNGDRCE